MVCDNNGNAGNVLISNGGVSADANVVAIDQCLNPIDPEAYDFCRLHTRDCKQLLQVCHPRCHTVVSSMTNNDINTNTPVVSTPHRQRKRPALWAATLFVHIRLGETSVGENDVIV